MFIIFLIFATPLIVLIILVKRYVDAKAEGSKKFTGFEVKITRLSESVDRVEKRLDKIDSLLEDVPAGNEK